MSANLLIVDDEDEIRSSLSRRYRLKGFSADTADSAESALAILENKPFKVVISDIMMPGLGGIELLRKIREEYPMTRVIMITGYVTLENGLACLRHGADTCVFKPFSDLKELDSAIDNALQYLKHWEDKLMQLKGITKNDKV
jgi:two-component system response regulator PilR (NtrC family)